MRNTRAWTAGGVAGLRRHNPGDGEGCAGAARGHGWPLDGLRIPCPISAPVASRPLSEGGVAEPCLEPLDRLQQVTQVGGGVVAEAGERGGDRPAGRQRSEEHTSELQSLMRISYAVFCLKKNNSISVT